MSDERERDLERRARAGDVEAGVQLLRALERRGAAGELLDRLEDEAPDDLLALFAAVPADQRLDHLPRLARLADRAPARRLLAAWHPPLGVISGDPAERAVGQVGAPARLRPVEELVAACRALRDAGEPERRAALLVAIERLDAMERQRCVDQGFDAHRAHVKKLVTELARRRLRFDEADLALLARRLGQVELLGLLPEPQLFEAIEHHVKRAGVGPRLREALEAAVEARRAVSSFRAAEEARFQERVGAILG